MLYWVPAGPSLSLSPRRKPRRVINVLAASSTDGGGPSSWLDSPVEADRHKEEDEEEEVGGRGERKGEERQNVCQWWAENKTAAYFATMEKKKEQPDKLNFLYP